MTDNRIEKIRVIIQHFADRGTEEYKESIDRDVTTDAGYWHGYADCANALLFKIDSLQEEPKLLTGKTKLEKIMAVADNMPRATLALSPTDNAVSSDWERRMVDAAESLGISQVDYNKAIDELIYGKEKPVSKSFVDIETPFGSMDSELIEESIVIPKGCHAVIEGNKVVIRKGEEPASEDLDEAADKYSQSIHSDYSNDMFDSHNIYDAVIYGANWQKSNLWKSADGDDLPEIDREVIALLDNGKVVFAHRPPEYWDGKDIVTGKVTRNYPKTYDKCGWNIPNVKYWLDCLMPKEIEL